MSLLTDCFANTSRPVERDINARKHVAAAFMACLMAKTITLTFQLYGSR